jgi:hypothetical protein
MRLTPRQNKSSQKKMQNLATKIRDKLLNIAGDEVNAPRLFLAGFEIVTHEVGTIRLQILNSEKEYVINKKY